MTPMKISLHGRKVGVDQDDKFVSDGAITTGWPGKTEQIVLPGSRKTVAFFDDFLGDALAGEWNLQDGTDTGSKATQAITAATNGVARVASATGIGDSGGISGLSGELNWKANQGKLRLSARVKIPAITTVNAFIGLTDTKNSEPPFFEDSGTAALVSNATDAVGWLFSTQNSKTTWQGVGVQTNTDTTPVTGTAPTANVYETFEIELDTGGDAAFYQNGVLVGTAADAVHETVALAPVFSVYSFAAGTQRTFDADYINVSANRDTGT